MRAGKSLLGTFPEPRGDASQSRNSMVILEPEAGYLMILAGLDQNYVEPGRIVDTGAPVGFLGGKRPGAKKFLIEASEGGAIAKETLYIEFRNDGEPIDPETWFAISDS